MRFAGPLKDGMDCSRAATAGTSLCTPANSSSWFFEVAAGQFSQWPNLSPICHRTIEVWRLCSHLIRRDLCGPRFLFLGSEPKLKLRAIDQSETPRVHCYI